MLKKITLVLSSFLITFLVCSNIFATDMTVFGLKLGEKFDLAECDKYPKIEVYQINKKGVCFQRSEVKYPIRDKKPSTSPIVNDLVWISFPTNEYPDVANDIRAVVIDGNLESIIFFTDGVKNGEFVLESLTRKYGKPTNLISSKVQNGLGATFDAYVAEWTFDNLFVVFKSVTDTIKYGRAEINTKKHKEIEEKKLKDLNKNKRIL